MILLTWLHTASHTSAAATVGHARTAHPHARGGLHTIEDYTGAARVRERRQRTLEMAPSLFDPSTALPPLKSMMVGRPYT